MRKRSKDEIRQIVENKYLSWICCYGLKDALRVCTELKRKLVEEKKRRNEK